MSAQVLARTAIQPASSAPVIAVKCTVAIGTQVPSASSPVSWLQRGRPDASIFRVGFLLRISPEAGHRSEAAD